MLFLLTHQTYELWFKQIIWEIDSVLKADFLKTYGLAMMELSQFEKSIAYLHRAEEILCSRDDGILIDIYFVSPINPKESHSSQSLHQPKKASHTHHLPYHKYTHKS